MSLTVIRYPPGAREIIEEQVEEVGGGWRIPVISDDEVDLYFGEHGLSEKQRGWFRAHAVGQPVETFRQPLRMKDAEAADRLPRTYVRCTGTPVPVPIESAPNWDCLEISAGHWPMITRPRELSHVLNQVAALPAPA